MTCVDSRVTNPFNNNSTFCQSTEGLFVDFVVVDTQIEHYIRLSHKRSLFTFLTVSSQCDINPVLLSDTRTRQLLILQFFSDILHSKWLAAHLTTASLKLKKCKNMCKILLKRHGISRQCSNFFSFIGVFTKFHIGDSKIVTFPNSTF